MTTTYAVGQRLTATVLQAIADATVNRPVCRLIQQAGQSLANASDVALQFAAGSEDVDTSGMHDEVTNNTRITPTKAGYYTFYSMLVTPAGTDFTSLQVGFRKNGSTILPSVSRNGPNATSSFRATEGIIYSIQMNGTTDYIEAMGNQTNGAAAARTTPSSGGSTSCLFGAIYERDL